VYSDFLLVEIVVVWNDGAERDNSEYIFCSVRVLDMALQSEAFYVDRDRGDLG
jgi:hypothetical protein